MIPQLHAEMTAALLEFNLDDRGVKSWRMRELQDDIHRLEAVEPQLEQRRIDEMAKRLQRIAVTL